MATSMKKRNGSIRGYECIVILAQIFVTLSTVVAVSPHLSRKITILYNEQCNRAACQRPANSTDSYYNLAHVIAKSPNDTLHYLWSSIGAPGMLLVRTSNKAKLTVDWDKLLGEETEALVFTPQSDIIYSAAFVFTRLIEYNDTQKKANLQLAFANETLATPLDELTWQDLNTTIDDITHSGVFNMTYNTSTDAQLGPNATFALRFQVFGSTRRSGSLPHLQSTSNTSQVELILQNLGLHYKQTRFAIELLVLQNQPGSDKVTLSVEKSIDDEYTPSVFEVFNIKLPSSSQQGSFVQWKPVTYDGIAKSLNNAVQTRNYGLNISKCFIPKWSIAHAFYSNISTLDKATLNVSFGLPGDSFYADTNYTSWTISIGYGTPPEETVSLTIIIIISVSLGIPLILLLFGGLVIGIKKNLPTKNKEYETFENNPGSINT